MDPRPDDELASAYLDEEATPDERALVEGDAQLLARVEQLRAARAALATPVPPLPAAVVDEQIAAALFASAEAAEVDDEPERPLAPVVPLRRRRVLEGVATVAAMIAVAVVAMSFLGTAASSQFSSVGNSINGAGGGFAFTSDRDLQGAEAADALPEVAPVAPPPGATLPPTTTQPASPATTASGATGAEERAPALGPLADDDEVAARIRSAAEEPAELDAMAAAGALRSDELYELGGGPPGAAPTSTASCGVVVPALHRLATDVAIGVQERLGRQVAGTATADVAGVPSVLVLLSSRDAAAPAEVELVLVVDPSGCVAPRTISLR